MPVMMIITLSLTVALAFVVFMRRSLTSRLTSWSARLARRTTKLSTPLTDTTETDEAPRRMRPRLALSVSGVPSHEAVRSAQNPPTTDGAVAVDDVLNASAPPDVPREARELEHTVAGTHEGDHAAQSNRGPVDAPGWPSPGELAGKHKLDEFDSSSPGERFAEDGAPETVDAVGEDAQPFDTASAWVGDHDRGGSTMTVPPLVDWDQSFATESAGDAVATLSLPTATDATVWDDVDEYPEATAGGAQQEWNAAAWEWKASDAPGSSSDWPESATDDEPVSKQDDPVDPAAPAVSPGAPRVHVVDVPMWTQTVDSAVARNQHPTTDYERVIAAAVRPFVAAAGTVGASAPVIVVVVPETRASPTDREDELARAVRRLEKRLAALTDPKPIPAKRPNQAPRTKRSAAAPTTVFTLTKVEERTLRALAAHHSTPVATRRRARIVLATARGLNVAAIALRVGAHRTTVRRWQVRFAAKRLAALNDTRPRRAPKR